MSGEKKKSLEEVLTEFTAFVNKLSTVLKAADDDEFYCPLVLGLVKQSYEVRFLVDSYGAVRQIVFKKSYCEIILYIDGSVEVRGFNPDDILFFNDDDEDLLDFFGLEDEDYLDSLFGSLAESHKEFLSLQRKVSLLSELAEEDDYYQKDWSLATKSYRRYAHMEDFGIKESLTDETLVAYKKAVLAFDELDK